VDRLEAALAAVVRGPGKEGSELDLRRHAAGALSGMTLNSFDVLLELLGEDDLELKSIACTGADRIWNQLDDELPDPPSGEYERVDQALLARWATTAYCAAHKHGRQSNRGIESAIQEEHGVRKDVFVRSIGGSHLRWIAQFRAALDMAGLLDEWQWPSPEAKAHLLLLQSAYEEFLQKRTPIPLAPDDDRLFRGWRDMDLEEAEIEHWNDALLAPKKHLETVWRKNPHEYENTWKQLDEENRGRRKADGAVGDSTRARLFFDHGEVRIDGTARSVEWKGARSHFANTRPIPSSEQATVFQLATPEDSEVLFVAVIPEGAIGATVRFVHDVPSRAILPYCGIARMEFDFCDGEMVTNQTMGALHENRQAFVLPRLMVEKNDG